MSTKILTSLFSLLLSLSLTAQIQPEFQQIIDAAENDMQAMEHLDVLCNRFGGRLIGSDAYENAANWVGYKLQEWGLEVVMDEVGELPVGFNRGPWFGRLIGEHAQTLHFATPSYTSGTKGVQRGHVLIEPKTQAEFDRMKGQLNGAWVLISGKSSGWPIDYSEHGNQLRDSIKVLNDSLRKENSTIKKYNKDIRSKNTKQKNSKKHLPEKELLEIVEMPALFYQDMVDAGILGIIQSASTPIRVLYDRKNVHQMTFETLPVVPDIKLDEHQYELIHQMAKERRYFQLEFDIRNHFKMGPVPYHNVIGIIPGSEYPDEYVIVGGHLDAFDVATGGVDDGSGVTPSMEAVRLIMKAGLQPKRTILLTLWAGEEFGLYGSRSWVRKYSQDLSKVSNMINRDGGPTVPEHMSVSKAMWDDFVPMAEAINSINPDFPFELKEREPTKKPARAWGTDSGPFAVAGVPTIGFRNGDPKGYNFDYYEIWHTERDLYNKSIPEYQEHAAVATAILTFGIANLDHLLDREGYYLKEAK